MPTIKGTASVTDDHAMAKLLKKTTFPSNFSTPVEVSKVNIPVMSQWVERKITELLGFEDEIVASTAINLFLPTALEGAPPPKVDPKRSQLDLVGFLGEDDAAAFCKELWTLLLDAQETSTGIPRKLLEDTKKELASRQHHQRRQHRGMPPGGARRGGHEQSRVMNPMVREASRRAEAARQAFANAPPPLARRQDAQPPAAPASGSNPVPVSPPRVADHAFEPRPPPQSRREDGRDDFGRAPRNPNDDNGNNNRYNNHNPRSDQQPPRRNSPSRSNSESVSSSSSASSNSYYDSEEDQRRDRRGGGGGGGERWRRYEDEEDRRRARYRQEDGYGRPRHPPRHRNDDYQHRHGRHGHYDRERNHRGDRDDRRRRERSRSYERNERRGGRHRRTRSFSD